MTDKTRMIEWLLLAAFFYAVSVVMYHLNILPEMQVVGRKLGHITVAAFLGYWIDRRSATRIRATSTPLEQIRRAIIIAAAMLAIAIGL